MSAIHGDCVPELALEQIRYRPHSLWLHPGMPLLAPAQPLQAISRTTRLRITDTPAAAISAWILGIP